MLTPNRLIFRSQVEHEREVSKETALDFGLRLRGALGQLTVELSIPTLPSSVEALKKAAKKGVHLFRGLISGNLAHSDGELDETDTQEKQVNEEKSPHMKDVEEIQKALDRIKNSPGALGKFGPEGQDAANLAILQKLNALKRFLNVLDGEDSKTLSDYLSAEIQIISEKLKRLENDISGAKAELEFAKTPKEIARLNSLIHAMLSRKEEILEQYNNLTKPSENKPGDTIAEGRGVDSVTISEVEPIASGA